MNYIPAQYAAYPATTALLLDYSSCYPIELFIRNGVEYAGLEAQPHFSVAQANELEVVGAVVFDSAQQFLSWKSWP